MYTSIPTMDEQAFLSALAFLLPTRQLTVASADEQAFLAPGLAIIECAPNSIPLLATLELLETMHHSEVYILILGLVQLESIKQLQQKHTSKEPTHQ
jgi:hypothetical protein